MQDHANQPDVLGSFESTESESQQPTWLEAAAQDAYSFERSQQSARVPSPEPSELTFSDPYGNSAFGQPEDLENFRPDSSSNPESPVSNSSSLAEIQLFDSQPARAITGGDMGTSAQSKSVGTEVTFSDPYYSSISNLVEQSEV